MRQERIDASNLELTEKVVSIKRTAEKSSGRYWSYRRWSGSCGNRDGRNQEHPYKISGI